MKELLAQICQAKLYDLAQSYFVGLPHFPAHPPFLFGLTGKVTPLVQALAQGATALLAKVPVANAGPRLAR